MKDEPKMYSEDRSRNHENEEFSSMATYQIKSPELKESFFKVDTDLTSIFQEYREVQS